LRAPALDWIVGRVVPRFCPKVYKAQCSNMKAL